VFSGAKGSLVKNLTADEMSPYSYARYPYVANWVAHKLWIEPRLESYLFSVLKGLKRFAETGKTVTENPWGSHPWFSSKTHN
jgi:hypothetical protein